MASDKIKMRRLVTQMLSNISTGTQGPVGPTGDAGPKGDKGDTGTSGVAQTYQVEVDFGPVGKAVGHFTIIDAAVTSDMHIVAQIAYESPTSKDLDELDMDNVQILCKSNNGSLTLCITTADGSFLHDKFKINYTRGS